MHLPGPLRAAVGLVASAAEEVRHLPDRAIELPMLAVSTALQASLRAQQRYARLAAKGDAVLNRRPVTDEPPEWATFDEPVPVEELRRAAGLQFDDADGSARQVLVDLFGTDDPAGDPAASASSDSTEVDRADAPPASGPVEAAPAAPRKAAAKKKAAPRKTPTKRAAPGPRGKAGENSGESGGGKTVNGPRHTPPSRFDAVGDDD